MEKFVACLNCMDGRVQEPVISWVKENLGIPFVDMITEPGIDGLLGRNSEEEIPPSVLAKLQVSIEKHGSKTVIVVGHYDCAGNPVDENTHKEHLRVAVEKIRKLYPELTVIGLWVSEKFRAERWF